MVPGSRVHIIGDAGDTVTVHDRETDEDHRAERAAIIVTTNLPLSEWTTVFPNPRLCKAAIGPDNGPKRERSLSAFEAR